MTQEIAVKLPDFMMTYFAEPATTVDKILKVHQKFYEVLSYLNISCYSSTIQKVLVIGVALSPETFPEKERLFFRKKQNKLEIRINMDYQSLLEADETETLHLISKTYLLAVERFLSKRKDFDHKRFQTDVRKLFEENKLLPNPIFSKKSIQAIRTKFLSKK